MTLVPQKIERTEPLLNSGDVLRVLQLALRYTAVHSPPELCYFDVDSVNHRTSRGFVLAWMTKVTVVTGELAQVFVGAMDGNILANFSNINGVGKA